MKLSDVMAAAGLELYAEVALVLFVAVFATVLFRTFNKARRAELDAAGALPLTDATIVAKGGIES